MITCPTGKIAYPSPQAAWHAADVLRRRRTRRSRAMRGHNTKSLAAYRCTRCTGWHVTSSRDDDFRSRTA